MVGAWHMFVCMCMCSFPAPVFLLCKAKGVDVNYLARAALLSICIACVFVIVIVLLRQVDQAELAFNITDKMIAQHLWSRMVLEVGSRTLCFVVAFGTGAVLYYLFGLHK